MTKSLPANPSLEYLKNEAKSVLKSHKKEDPSSCEVLRHLHQFKNQPDEKVLSAEVQLSEVQFALAMKYGFESWNDIKNHIQSLENRIKINSPVKEAGNTYARGMRTALSYLGAEISYEEIMGLTGVAFILQVDTSGPFNDEGLDCAWWPNDAWGFDLGVPVLSKAVGLDIQKRKCNFKSFKADPEAEYRRAFAPVIKKSLEAGRPVLAEHDHCFIVTATDNQKPPLLGYGTHGKSTLFEDTIRISCYPWGLYTFGEKSEVKNPEEVDLASLQHIIALYNENAQGSNAPKTRFSGRQAWKEWLNLLHDGHACDNNMLIHLRYNRRSAVEYLRKMAKRHSGETASHLSAAAKLYQDILDEAMKQGLPWTRVNKAGEDANIVRSDYTAMVEKILELEGQAISELEVAAKELES